MLCNPHMLALGEHRSVIREIFEYSRRRAALIGDENVFDFSLGNPSVKPPHEVTATLAELIATGDPTALHGYTSAQGDAEARAYIAAKLSKDSGVPVTGDHIYMTCGAAASLAITLRALLCEGEECVVIAPFFTEYRVFVESAGGKLAVARPDETTLLPDLHSLAACINERTKAVLINSPNNPSGVIYGEETLAAIASLLTARSAEYGHPIYLIADEPYRALAFDGAHVPFPMCHYPNTIVCYSYSKSLSLPGERIGYIAVSPAMQEAERIYLAVCGAGRALGYVCAPSLFQHLLPRIGDVTVDVDVYRENRDILLRALTDYGFTCVDPTGAFYLMLRSPEPSAAAFCEKAKQHEILIVPCDDFGIQGYARIAYCVEKERIERSLPAFRALANEYFSNNSAAK